jgi:hypothetical protein
MSIFNQITVNLETGEISYPKIPGFTLDKERVCSSARRFSAYCSLETAVRHAIHEQIGAYRGLIEMQAAG